MTSFNPIYKAFKFRLYPTKEQEVFFERSVGSCRFVYNKLLAASLEEYERSGKFIFGFDLTNLLVELKKEYPWLKEVNSQSLQQASRHLNTSFKNRFSKNRKKQAGFPKFKSKHGSSKSFMIPQHFIIKKNQIKIPKIGWVAAVTDRKLEGEVKSLTVSKDVDVWFVSILCEIEGQEVNYDPNNVVGLDLGIKTFATTSDGELIESPDLTKHRKKLKKLQRQHSRKHKGSKNRDKARIKVARQHRKIRRINKNFIEVTSTAIAKLYDVAAIEDLNIQDMKKNRRLSGAIQKLNWGGFVEGLKRKMPLTYQVSRRYPSSKTCSCCGYIKKDLTLADRVYFCTECGFEMDRDINAAINIRQEYQRTVASAGIACGGDVRPEGTCSGRQTPLKQEHGAVGLLTT